MTQVDQRAGSTRARSLAFRTAFVAFALAGIAGVGVAAPTTDLSSEPDAVQPARVPPGTIGAPASTGRVDSAADQRLAELGERLGRLRLNGEALGTFED